MMDEKQYIKDRLDNQIDWFNKKSSFNQRWYKRLQVIVIVASASIPFLSGFIDENGFYLKIAVGALGLLIAAITAILGLYQFQANWLGYRTTCESLIQEKHLFLTGADAYAVEAPFALLVERVESLIAKDSTNWSGYMKRSQENNGKSRSHQNT